MINVSDAISKALNGMVGLLIIRIEHPRHSRSWGIAVEERIGTLPAIAVRGTDRSHFIVIQHHRSIWDIDDERI